MIGDGALTGGPAFEGLNSLGPAPDGPVIIVLNDNGHSYAPAPVALANHLNTLNTLKTDSTHDLVGDLSLDHLTVLRTLFDPRCGDITQPGPLGPGEGGEQTRRDREHDAPVIILTSNDTWLTGLDKFLEAAADKETFPLDDGLLRIEVAERVGLECTSRPGLKRQSR